MPMSFIMSKNVEHNNTTTLTIERDIVSLDKMERKCLIIDVACLVDTRVKDKEKEKIENYQDLKRELKRIWKLRTVTIVPIMIGTTMIMMMIMIMISVIMMLIIIIVIIIITG